MSTLVSNLEAKWYPVRVRPRNEFRISDLFREKVGLCSRVPCQKLWKLKKGKKIVRTRPLLSTYVFILSDLKNINWRLFYSVGGILGFIKFGGAAQPILEEQMLNLERLGAGDAPVHEIDYSKLKFRDRVEVIDGPLKGAVGKYIKTGEKKGRFIVELDFFRRALVTEMEEGYIRPC